MEVEALQYGALGLLAIVLIGVGAWVRASLNSSHQFIEQVARGAIEARDEHNRTLRELTQRYGELLERSTEAQEQVAAALRVLNETNNRLCAEVQELRKIARRARMEG